MVLIILITLQFAKALKSILLIKQQMTTAPAKSTKQLLNSLFVYSVCSSKHLVSLAPRVLDITKNTPLQPLLNAVIRRTFFEQFCAGETLPQAMKTVGSLHENGINTIVDFTIEADTSGEASFYQCVSTYTSLLKSIIVSSHYTNSIIALKLSSFFDISLLRHWSSSGDGPINDNGSVDTSYLGMRFIKSLVSTASLNGVKITIDAEQSEIQPIINKIALALSQEFNKNTVVVINTYQAYLTNVFDTLLSDYTHSKVNEYLLGVKLVRGAYMVSEPPGVIHKSKYDTDVSYNTAMGFLIKSGVYTCLATHNTDSMDIGIQLIKQTKASNVSFAHLYGMKDSHTNSLVELGLKVYKYVPYGPVSVSIPYLLRRTQENADAILHTQSDYTDTVSELKSRIVRFLT